MNHQIPTNGMQQAGEQLEKAFQLFNEHSEKLADSYEGLQERVDQLSNELACERDQRLIELAEKESLAVRLEGLLDALPAGVVVLDDNGIIIQTNKVANEILEFEHKAVDLIGRQWAVLAKKVFINEGKELRLKDGRWLNITACALEGSVANNVIDGQRQCTPPGKIILISDVSETRTLHKKLNQQQRLSSLGEMIAGLAHQIRTPLASAMLYISTANHPSTTLEKRLSLAEKAKHRLCHLERMVNDMLIFARGDVIDAEQINASVFFNKLVKLVESDYEAQQITLFGDNALKRVLIHINSDMVLSAVQNIINNAIEASNASSVNKPRKVQLRVVLNDENEIVINVVDNGSGMSDEIKDKILEPFFTTRENGTGLGLSVVSATINRYGGELKIFSEKNKGSDFSITFPCVEQHMDLSTSRIAEGFNHRSVERKLKMAQSHEVKV